MVVSSGARARGQRLHGSIACRGANEGGKLGVASPDFLDTDTIVAPPGSIDVSCTL